jgi:hypothetical protein
MRLKEHGPAQLGLHGEHGGVEALEVSGLENALLLFGESDEIVGFGQRGGQGLFDEKIEARVEQRGGDRVVMDRGHGNTGGVEMKVGHKHFVCCGKDRDGVVRGGLGCARGVGLNGGDQRDRLPGRFKLAIDTKMVAAEGARAGNGDAGDGLACYCAAPLPSTALRQRV